MKEGRDQRRSQRIRHELIVELHEKRGPRKLHCVDVARHGLFLATDDPPRERHLVQLTVHLPDGPIRAAGSVTRTLKGQVDHEDGCGIQFFALSDEAKQRWDDFIFSLQRTTPARGVPRPSGSPEPEPASASGATFLVKLKDVARLKDFAATHLGAGGTVLFTPVLRQPGEIVTLVVVHPKSDEEFRLPGVIYKAHADRPKRLEIHFHGVTPALLNAFAAYVETGRPPRVQLEPPVLPKKPPSSPFDNDLDLDVDVFDEPTVDTDDRIWRRPGDVTSVRKAFSAVSFEASFDNEEPVKMPEPETPEVSEPTLRMRGPEASSAPPSNPDDLSIPRKRPTTSTVVEDVPVVDPVADAKPSSTPPTTLPPTPIDPGLKPTTFLLRCDKDGCAAEPYRVDLGPLRGALGLVANHTAFLSNRTGRVVTSPRLATADERQQRTKAFLEGGGRLDASVDVMTLLGAVALVEPAKDADGPLKQTRAVERLEGAAMKLLDGGATGSAKTKVACPVCKEGHLTVELDAAK